MERVDSRCEIRQSAAPSIAEKDALVNRREDLMGSLRGAELDSARRRVAKLFGMMPVWGLDAESAAATVSDYGKALSSQPLWAIDAACISILESGAKFRPGAPEFLALAKKASDPFRNELYDVKSVLDARIYTELDPTERERVLARFRELTGSAAKATQPTSAPGPANKRPVPTPEDDRFAHLRTPLTASDRLRTQNAERAVGMAKAVGEGR